MKKRYEFLSSKGREWTDWFDWESDWKPAFQLNDRTKLKNEYKL